MNRTAFTRGYEPYLSRPPYWLFFLFAFYGPSFSLLGELRYVEVAVLGVLFLNFSEALRYTSKLDRVFVGLFLVTALMQLISDIVNDAGLDGTIKRSGTYVTLALLVIGVRYLSRGDPMRLRWMLGGYCLSYVTVLFLGQTASRNYENESWRLGLGTAATIAICLIPMWMPRLYRFVGPALLIMSVVHVATGARSMAVIVAVAGLLSIWGALRAPAPPRRFRLSGVLLVIFIGLFAIISAYQAARWATEAQLFPPDIQAKMEIQFSHPYGILAAARPDTIAALYGITKRPLLGFGSTNVDPDVYAFYLHTVASTYIWTDRFEAMRALLWAQEWDLGTPSHSHLLGAWVDAGIVAAFSWAAFIAIAVYVLQGTMSWHHPAAPLCVLISLLVLWDTLFSPGPIRMDIALRLSTLLYGIDLLRRFSRNTFFSPQRPSSRYQSSLERAR